MIPVLFISIAVATAAGGIGTGIKGGINQYQAQQISKNADERLVEAATKLDIKRQLCKDALDYLGHEKLFVLNNSMKRFVDTFGRIKNVNLRESKGLEELRKLNLDQKGFDEIVSLTHIAASITEGTLAGAASGAVTALGAYGSVMAFASASTGTAISSLSGAAATNATLAFLGGGSLASGGLGMAGGAVVLGGLVAGPALLVMGIIINAQTGKNLEKAKVYAAQADEIIAEYEAGDNECTAIRRRTYMFYNLLAKLDSMFYLQTYAMEEIINNEGDDFTFYSEESKKAIAITASTAATIKAVLDTPILKEDGSLTEESKSVMENMYAELTSES